MMKTTAISENALHNFLTDLATIARDVGQQSYAFVAEDGACRGWVQLIFRRDNTVEIHRLWTLKPGGGNGTAMLRAVCALADRHGISIRLKALPFGRKPFKFSADELATWYARHGFVGTPKKMIRHPRRILLHENQAHG